jgi:hypothetical protein
VKEISRSGEDGAVNTPPRGVRGFARRTIALGTILLLAIGGLAVTPMDTFSSGADGVAMTDDLNLRAEPALNAAILDVIPAGALVDVTGDAVGGFYPGCHMAASPVGLTART